MNVFEEIKKLGLTEKEYTECLQTIEDKKNGVNDYDWQEIVDMYHLPLAADTLRKSQALAFGGASVYEYMKSNSENASEDTTSNLTINKDGSYSSTRLVNLNAQDLKNPESLLLAHGFDPDEWSIVSAKNNLRETGKNSLYASYLTVKPKDTQEISFQKISEFFDKLDRKYASKADIASKVKDNLDRAKTASEVALEDGRKMLLFNIADLHMNLQSSMLTAGTEYNCDIAEKIFFDVIGDVLNRTKAYNFEKIVFCIGGDMLNGDSPSGCTTKGTPQNSDVHYYDAYERLCAMTVEAIEILKDFAKVEVIYVPGNHDEATGFKLAKFVDAWFRWDDDVSVDYSPLPRKYTVFGKTLFCFTHDGNAKTLPALIADEARKYWSEVEMTEVFLQHLHSEQILSEDNNIRIQRLPTISAKSKWANDSGFNSRRQCKSFVFDKEDGLIDVIYTCVKRG